MRIETTKSSARSEIGIVHKPIDGGKMVITSYIMMSLIAIASLIGTVILFSLGMVWQPIVFIVFSVIITIIV